MTDWTIDRTSKYLHSIRAIVHFHQNNRNQPHLPERIGLKPQAREKLKSDDSLFQSSDFQVELALRSQLSTVNCQLSTENLATSANIALRTTVNHEQFRLTATLVQSPIQPLERRIQPKHLVTLQSKH
ncbi:MAG: hypothetical protein EAZ39_31150 [Oscillatoriales cyanobacterium]|uniref:hypothetical protein n=1 Tax=Microcoleus sp. PH2017_05_CCC_O_A TaxID=2798816 RepID=UPI001DA58CC1|nr:hypothetical protein [Microcoleus sp. PH2017_05_CCC_O_A]TAG00231.1 MAG: hypothetical protein EAZ45_15850 [Oscillatoriales cyanobacterium]MCC3437746.1 hypothetical protein [Microcoleus sp. PH2017_05_CCC_O_A]TAG12107.1 MAG: hypothetical protein EAZ39_31150 [Oscillatoriales cyanobacterium]TAG34070.1 MAG: hypothetical protein EAZ33_28290 [Oscillatoriales cyanobacterium]TAG58578.1 MAG: hypothetical protein EAZ28_14375 [Oscillatoriales cyanobacterium]